MKKLIYNHSIDADKESLEQFKECYSQDFVTAAALMPDAHKGYAAPIGAVLITKDYVVPAWVGFDIGCGLIAVRVKGKDNPVAIYEPIAERDEISFQEEEEISLFHQCLDYYRQQDWNRAEKILAQRMLDNPTRNLYKNYLQRIAIYRESPPGDESPRAPTCR